MQAPIMQHARLYVVIRPGVKPDPYTPGGTIPDWDNTTEATVAGFLSHDTTAEAPDLNRASLNEAAILTIPGPDADIARGDRVRDTDGREWQVDGHPRRDINPFTGWAPSTAVRLQRWEG